MQTVGATLKYDGDGTDPSATTTTTTALVTINGDTTSKLPPNSTVGKSYPVTFTFTNPDKERTVTNVEFTPTYPPEFTQTTNGCNTAEAKGSIPPLGNCQVTGNLVPTSATTPLTVAGALTYSGDGQTTNVTTSTTPTIVVVNGETTTPLYKDTAKDFTYPVKFTFKNTNTKQPATDISIIPNYPAAFTETKNTCVNNILQNESCTVEGTFAPTTTGQNVVGVTLKYNNDKQVKLETSTEVLDSTFKADISPGLPGHINRGSTSTQGGYNVTFKWTNIGGRPITINQYTIAAANNLSKNDVSNDCDNGKTLQAGESCNYQAYLYGPPNLGAASLNTSMSFKDTNGKDHDLAASTSTDVIDGAYIDYRFRIPAPYPGWVEFQLNGQGNPIYGNLWKAGNYQIQACYYGLGDCGPWQPYCNITVTNAGTITTSYVGPGEPQGCCAIHTHDHATSSNAQKLIAGYDTSLTNCNLPF